MVAAAAVAAEIVMRRTPFGVKLYAIGETARGVVLLLAVAADQMRRRRGRRA